MSASGVQRDTADTGSPPEARSLLTRRHAPCRFHPM